MICIMFTCMVVAPCMVARVICIGNDRNALNKVNATPKLGIDGNLRSAAGLAAWESVTAERLS
jgi:hypothetical protein